MTCWRRQDVHQPLAICSWSTAGSRLTSDMPLVVLLIEAVILLITSLPVSLIFFYRPILDMQRKGTTHRIQKISNPMNSDYQEDLEVALPAKTRHSLSLQYKQQILYLELTAFLLLTSIILPY